MKIIALLLLCGASFITASQFAIHQECFVQTKIDSGGTLTIYNESCPEKSAVISNKKISSIASGAFVNNTLEDLTLKVADPLKLESGSFNGLKELKKLSIQSRIVPVDENVFEPIKNIVSLELKIDAADQTLVESIPKVFVNLTEFKIFNGTIRGIGGADLSYCESCSKISSLSVTESKITLIEPKAFQSFMALKELQLSKNSLTNLQPETFDCLDKLINLELNENKLTTITKDIFMQLKSLKALDLMENELETIEEGAFDGLHNLKYLNLKSNKLASIPDNIFASLASLKILDLSQNKLQIIPTGQFSGLSHLVFLGLTENSIKKIEINAFSGSSIEYLRLGGNNLTILPNGVFNNMDKLESLTLVGNKIQEIPKNVFNGLEKLRNLALGHNLIETIKADAFSGLVLDDLSLESNNLMTIDADFRGLTVRKLDLAYNKITKIEEGAFVNSSLDVLNLNNARINIDPASWGLSASTLISALNRDHDFIDTLNDPYYFSKEALLTDP